MLFQLVITDPVWAIAGAISADVDGILVCAAMPSRRRTKLRKSPRPTDKEWDGILALENFVVLIIISFYFFFVFLSPGHAMNVLFVI